MKLNKDNFEKTIVDDLTIYKYNCNDTNFFLELVGNNENRNINVFKGSLDDRQELKTTKDTLEAWNYFETLLVACQSEQGYSGGDIKNPQENPNLLPLLAIGSVDSHGFRNITLFVVLDNTKQKKAFDFKVSVDTMPQPLPDDVFEVDWSGEDITQFLKAEVLLKRFEDVKFEEDPDKKVFLFIPKSLITQGGDEGGNTAKGGTSGSSGSSGSSGTDGTSGSDGSSGSSGTDGTSGSDGSSGSSGEIGSSKTEKMNFSDTIQQLSKSTDGEYPPSELIGLFRSVGTGEVWLSQNNFPKIKKDLGLPINMTPRQLSEIIINSK